MADTPTTTDGGHFLRTARSKGDVPLSRLDTAARPVHRRKTTAKQELAGPLATALTSAHDKLIATEGRVLLVLQGLDASGKSGTIRHVVGHLNPVGVRVASFKEPTRAEAKRHFLWRIEQQLPEPGELVVFDRSHYEDLVVPLATDRLDRTAIARRAQRVNQFEHDLVESGTTVVKCFLHLSHAEQQERFLRRLHRRDKQWKFSVDDLDTRDRWDAFMAAYDEVLAHTDTSAAPWHVIPADRKWYRNWAVASVLHDAFERLDLRYPRPDLDVKAIERRLGVAA